MFSRAEAGCGQEVNSGAFELRGLFPSFWSVGRLVRFWLGTGSGLTGHLVTLYLTWFLCVCSLPVASRVGQAVALRPAALAHCF